MPWEQGPYPQGGDHLAGGRVQEIKQLQGETLQCGHVVAWKGITAFADKPMEEDKDTEWRPESKQLPPPGLPMTCPQGSASPGHLAASR